LMIGTSFTSKGDARFSFGIGVVNLATKGHVVDTDISSCGNSAFDPRVGTVEVSINVDVEVRRITSQCNSCNGRD